MTTTTTDRNVKLFIRLIDSESPDTLGVVQGHMKRVGKGVKMMRLICRKTRLREGSFEINASMRFGKGKDDRVT